MASGILLSGAAHPVGIGNHNAPFREEIMLSTDRRTFVRTAGAGAATAAAFMAVAPANAADDALYVIAELVAKPDKADDLRKLLVEFVAGVRKEPAVTTRRCSKTASRPAGSSLSKPGPIESRSMPT